MLGRKHVNKAAGKCITVEMRQRRTWSGAPARAGEKRGEQTGRGEKGKVRSYPSARRKKKEKKEQAPSTARVGSRAKESSDALFSDKTARAAPRLLARDFCAPHKGDSFYGASNGALSARGREEEGVSRREREYGLLSRG